MPLARPRHRAEYVRQERLRLLVAMQDRALATFLIIDHELHRDTGAAGPARVRRVATIAERVAAVGRAHGPAWPPGNQGPRRTGRAATARPAASVERSLSVISVMLPGGMARDCTAQISISRAWRRISLALSSRTSCGGEVIPAQTGSFAWHILQRDSTISSTVLKEGAGATAPVLIQGSPTMVSQAIVMSPSAATAHGHSGSCLPSWRML